MLDKICRLFEAETVQVLMQFVGFHAPECFQFIKLLFERRLFLGAFDSFVQDTHEFLTDGIEYIMGVAGFCRAARSPSSCWDRSALAAIDSG